MRGEQQLKWAGPVTVDRLIDCFFGNGLPCPPESESVYLVTQLPWEGAPTAACQPLYVGSNATNPRLFVTRLGSLIADMFGFFSAERGHHSGGQSIFQYCRENGINPRQLYIGWLVDCECGLCNEWKVWLDLLPKLNRREPPLCRHHLSPGSRTEG